jgi:hypothetical protein
MRKVFFGTAVAFLLLTASPGFGSALEAVDSMRCGSKLVQIGDNKIDILAKCGEPSLREKVTRSRGVKKSRRGSAVEQHTWEEEQWTFNFGPQDFLYTLTFEGAELTGIGRGGRGTRR